MVGEVEDVGAANEGVPAADQIRSVWRQTLSKIQRSRNPVMEERVWMSPFFHGGPLHLLT